MTESWRELEIVPRERDLGDGFVVRRVLPFAKRRLVGPFVFFDEMGPVEMPPGQGLDVRPHPHIGLSTVTYLFEGEILHRDSLGSVQPIRPGAVNWMTAGRGIVHSERVTDAVRAAGQRLHGIQTWLALPLEHERTEPGFSHHPADTMPERIANGIRMRVVAGHGFGLSAPIPVFSPVLYVALDMAAGAELTVPAEHEERAVYPLSGALEIEGTPCPANAMQVLKPGVEVQMRAIEPTRALLVGGAKLTGQRHIWWNFVASDPATIETAKEDWRAGRFATVPGDPEFIPLPEG
jgi:redox-sensitive bicupin YhaK (pirin superfamily)